MIKKCALITGLTLLWLFFVPLCLFLMYCYLCIKEFMQGKELYF